MLSAPLIVAFAALYSLVPAGCGLKEPEKQLKILDLLTHVSARYPRDNGRPHIPFDNPRLFKKDGVLERFKSLYLSGWYLEREDVFSTSNRDRKEQTNCLLDLLYYSKDFDTFYKVGLWSKGAIHPMQHISAVISAALLRNDTASLLLPPLYEILPHYYLPSPALSKVYMAAINGLEEKTIMLNGTLGNSIRNKGDESSESRLAYYREDVSRSDFFFKYYRKMDDRFDDGANRQEEWIYTSFRWILTRYNLERYALGMAPVPKLVLTKQMQSGYFTQVGDPFGNEIPSRSGCLVPYDVDPEGALNVERLLNLAETSHAIKIAKEDTREGYKKDEAMKNQHNYLSVYHHLLEYIDNLNWPSHSKAWEGLLSNELTRMRDPAYYQIISTIVESMRQVESTRQPYSKQQLGFPGVEIAEMKMNRLETFMEDYKFGLSEGMQLVGERWATQPRINHRGFKLMLRIRSQTEGLGAVRIFLGSGMDMSGRNRSLDELRRTFTLVDTFTVELRKGDNKIVRDLGRNDLTWNPLRFHEIKQKALRGSAGLQIQCPYPGHLVLPHGSAQGTPFLLMAVVHPLDRSSVGPSHSCGRDHLTLDTSRSLVFPLDRPWTTSSIQQPNIRIQETLIYHSIRSK